MAVTISDADVYIAQNVIDIDDWADAEEAKKQRILTAASTTLSRKYKDYEIPDAAVYEFAPVLAIVFSDTYKMQRYGVNSFSVKGISFSFAGDSAELEQLIPKTAVDLISELNGIDLTPKRRVGRSVR
ncbi:MULTISPECIES: hypothetical protein [Bacillus]|uniref:hypothetical protein n=1 Tax=Bacillus TaxID=1386 RepID=UPI0002ED9564|nr:MULTISPECIES: hypothetical protein [Bacillus]